MLKGKILLSLTVFVLFLTVLIDPVCAGFRDDYNSTYKAYQSAKTAAEYTRVAERFLKLSAREDAGLLRGNTFYWAAECWYAQKQYLHALNGFERVLLIPQSNKEEAARFKVAMCYGRLGWEKCAKWEMNRFLRDYPSSSLVKLIRKELKKLTGS